MKIVKKILHKAHEYKYLEYHILYTTDSGIYSETEQ